MTANLSYEQCLALKKAGYLQELKRGDWFYNDNYNVPGQDIPPVLSLHSMDGVTLNNVFPKCPTSVDEFVGWLKQRCFSSIDILYDDRKDKRRFVETQGFIGNISYTTKLRPFTILALFDIWEKAGRP